MIIRYYSLMLSINVYGDTEEIGLDKVLKPTTNKILQIEKNMLPELNSRSTI